MGKPQQPELRRSERGQIDQAQWSRKESAVDRPKKKGRRAPVPVENRPGYGPDAPEETLE